MEANAAHVQYLVELERGQSRPWRHHNLWVAHLRQRLAHLRRLHHGRRVQHLLRWVQHLLHLDHARGVAHLGQSVAHLGH
jgi:hypothetical protein